MTEKDLQSYRSLCREMKQIESKIKQLEHSKYSIKSPTYSDMPKGGFDAEKWKDIQGYEGKYQISSHGRVKSLMGTRCEYREKILKTRKNNCGYLYINLHKNGQTKHKLIHRLIAEAFIPNLNNYPCVNHKDENKENNTINNLEWCDYTYNNNYGKRIEKMVNKRKRKVICITTGEVFNSIKEAAEFYSIRGKADIGACCSGKRKSAGKLKNGTKLIWEYYE